MHRVYLWTVSTAAYIILYVLLVGAKVKARLRFLGLVSMMWFSWLQKVKILNNWAGKNHCGLFVTSFYSGLELWPIPYIKCAGQIWLDRIFIVPYWSSTCVHRQLILHRCHVLGFTEVLFSPRLATKAVPTATHYLNFGWRAALADRKNTSVMLSNKKTVGHCCSLRKSTF